jgi:hypothetical protein
MTIVAGAGISYSPLIYRSRDKWDAIGQLLRGDATQPKSAQAEDADLLDDYGRRIEVALSKMSQSLADAKLDAAIVLTADRGSQFDGSHVPQIHLQVGGEVWGDTAVETLGEERCRTTFRCDPEIGGLLIEELVRGGFDVAEGVAAFRPAGNASQGITPAAVEATRALLGDVPIIPLSINCHAAPVLGGNRLHKLGTALGEAAGMTGKRIGLVVSGGLSGDGHGGMAGWIDDVFDRWVLTRIERSRSIDLARVWDVPSRNLLTATTEVRLWMIAAAAFERAGCRASIRDYMPIHHAATGVAFVAWES